MRTTLGLGFIFGVLPAASTTLLEVVQDVGTAQQDFAAICQALAPM